VTKTGVQSEPLEGLGEAYDYGLAKALWTHCRMKSRQMYYSRCSLYFCSRFDSQSRSICNCLLMLQIAREQVDCGVACYPAIEASDILLFTFSAPTSPALYRAKQSPMPQPRISKSNFTYNIDFRSKNEIVRYSKTKSGHFYIAFRESTAPIPRRILAN